MTGEDHFSHFRVLIHRLSSLRAEGALAVDYKRLFAGVAAQQADVAVSHAFQPNDDACIS